MHSRFPSRRSLGLIAVLGLAGCATGDVAMLATIAGGEKLRVPLERGGVVRTNEGGVLIDTTAFALRPEKHFTHVFEFTDSRKRALRHVRVVDVSDEAPVVLVDQADPTLSATGQWHGESAPLAPSDPRLAWIATLSNSLRVYRFTLTFADGTVLVLNQGAMFPQPIKSGIRHSFGQNY
jgi:hypothetical protein